MRPAFVITEGGKKIGMGHIVRQFALCQLLNIENEVTTYIKTDSIAEESWLTNLFFKKTCLITDIDEAFEQIPANAIVFIDGYSFYVNRINQVKKLKNWQIIFIADVNKEVPDCEVLINHLPWITNNFYTKAIILKKLLGPKYAILRKPFYSTKKKPEEGRVLICLGGSDIRQQIDKIYSALISNGFPLEKIDVLYNNPLKNSSIKNLHYNLSAEQVFSLISRAHLCFITPGNISYEVFSINKIAIMGYISESQKTVAQKFHDLKLCYNIGAWDTADFKNLPIWITEAAQTKNAQKIFFNGLNILNIKNELSSYLN
jgi:UDP-2,4-diacetamido-2,4,6-trideoxy-beta-L-altropyranose hydrolase